MLMFMQHQIQKCVIHKYTTLEKESSNIGIKERKLPRKIYHNYIIEEFSNPYNCQN